MKKYIVLTATLLGIGGVSDSAFTQAPPPPPPVPSEKAAVDKATRLLQHAQTVVMNHKTFKTAEVAALKDPTNKDLKKAANTALEALATSIEDLTRNAKSLENDIKKLVNQELKSLTQEKTAIREQKHVSPKRKKSEEDLLNELKERLKKRQGK